MQKYWKYIVSALMFFALYLFWAIPYRSALNYQEEFQLFLIDWDYFIEHLTTEGGLAVYVSEFLVQFYNNYWIGAAILSAEFILIQWLSWKLLQKIFGKKHDWLLFSISFIPMLLVFIEIGEINTMHSLLIAVIEELIMAYVLATILTKKSLSRIKRYSICIILLPVFLAIYFWTAGPNHHRLESESFSLANVFNAAIYEQLDYDFLVRVNDWNGIISKAEKKQPNIPMTVCATNLALGMKGQLGERVNQFYQHGTEGLIPPFKRESFSSLTTAEVYFQLGLVNTAQRFYFESMEGLPNFNKSCRCIKRLAETNFINGQYDVACKYLRILKKTMFYRLWAERMLKLIDDGEFAIANHPLYGRMNMLRLTDDFLFSEKDMDKICGRLLMQNSSNRLAAQYLLLFPLLADDYEMFVQYMQVIDEQIPYNSYTESFRKYLRR